MMGKKLFRFLVFVGILIGLVMYIRGGSEKVPTDNGGVVIEDYSDANEKGINLDFKGKENEGEETEADNDKESVELDVNTETSGIKTTAKILTAPVKLDVPTSIATPVKKTAPVAANYETTEVKIYLYEWGIDISERNIPTGKIVFTVQNNGRFSHGFQIDKIKDFGNLVPGEKKTFNPIILRDGVFTMSSPKEVDRKRGMVESFTID